MTSLENYLNIFNSLIIRSESEVVEFKRAENSFDFDDLGKYFSALSNEANLRGLEFAWLIFGYEENSNLTLHDCISLDAIQKGHRIDEEIAQDLLKRGLIEGEAPNYTISLSVAKASKQLTGYTKVKGLERDKIKQMILQYIQNTGTDGAKRDAIMEYLEGTLPSRNTKEQNTQLVSNILKDMNSSNLISSDGKLWRAPK